MSETAVVAVTFLVSYLAIVAYAVHLHLRSRETRNNGR